MLVHGIHIEVALVITNVYQTAHAWAQHLLLSILMFLLLCLGPMNGFLFGEDPCEGFWG